MPEIDYEAAWADLKAKVLEKRSHGQSGLLEDMARLEVEHRVPAGGASLPPQQHPLGHSSAGRRRNAASRA